MGCLPCRLPASVRMSQMVTHQQSASIPPQIDRSVFQPVRFHSWLSIPTRSEGQSVCPFGGHSSKQRDMATPTRWRRLPHYPPLVKNWWTKQAGVLLDVSNQRHLSPVRSPITIQSDPTNNRCSNASCQARWMNYFKQIWSTLGNKVACPFLRPVDTSAG